jgi:membrane protease YdiL (CAAX protease family)
VCSILTSQGWSAWSTTDVSRQRHAGPMALSPRGPDSPPAIASHPIVPWGAGAGIAAVMLAFAVYFIGAVIVDIAWQSVAPGAAKNEGLDIGILSYQFLTLGTAVGAVVIVLQRHRLGVEALGFRFPGWQTLVASALLVIPIFLGVALIYSAFTTFLPGYHVHGNAQELLQGTTGHLTPLEKVGLFVFAGIEAPITEETLFRGILFQGLRQLFTRWLPYHGAVAAAAVLSGVVFGLLHFEPQTLPILAFLGIVLAYVFQYGKSIYASMVVHAIVNSIAVLALIQTS